MKFFIAVVILLGVASYAQAADYDVELCAVQTNTNSDYAFAEICGGWESKSGCPSGNYITWHMPSGQGQAMYSTAMAALLADKKVKIRVSSGNCYTYDKTQIIRIIK